MKVVMYNKYGSIDSLELVEVDKQGPRGKLFHSCLPDEYFLSMDICSVDPEDVNSGLQITPL